LRSGAEANQPFSAAVARGALSAWVDDWHLANPGTAAREDATTIAGFTSALRTAQYMRAKAAKDKENKEKRKLEEEKKAAEKRSAVELAMTQERRRKLASSTRSQRHLIDTYINTPRDIRFSGAKACDEIALKAGINSKAGFKFTSDAKKLKLAPLDFTHCPRPLTSIIDTFGDTRHAGNKNPEWPVALESAFENGATFATLVVEPDQLALIMSDAALSKYGVGSPCVVGASFDSLRMLCTSGGGILKGDVQWTQSEATDGGLLVCYLLPVHASQKAKADFEKGMRLHLEEFTERSLICGDGHEITRGGSGSGPPLLHVTPLSITVDMAAWVERGEHADPESKLQENAVDRRGLEHEPFPLALAIAAFLGLRMPMISAHDDNDPDHIWLSAGIPTRLPALFAACLKADKTPFVFLNTDHKHYEALANEFDLYSYFYWPSTADYFSVAGMPKFTLHRLLDLMVKACLEYPNELLPIEFLNTHTRLVELRKPAIPGMQNIFTNPLHRLGRSLDVGAQAAHDGVAALRIRSLNPDADEKDSEWGAFLLPMGKYNEADATAKVHF